MSEYTFRFLVNQADSGVIFTSAKVSSNPFAPGNQASWSSPSFKLSDATALQELEKDGGHWVGTVHMLPDNIFNMNATYFPIRGEADNIQFAGPIVASQSESAIAIVGGGGKYVGARGQARCVVAMSDKETPLYRYEVSFTV